MSDGTTLVRPERIERAISLFKLGGAPDGNDMFTIKLGCLGVEVSNRAMTKAKGAEGRSTQEHWLSFGRACDYMTKRLGDLSARLIQAQWIHQQRVEQGEEPRTWLARFEELAVKDFHSDTASLMDAIAPVVAQTSQPLTGKAVSRPPGFADVAGYDNSGRAPGFRECIPADVLEIVDGTKRWWKPVKDVRQVLSHRRHTTISFGHPSEGFFFQVYGERHEPLITDEDLLWPTGQNVVDFAMYSAFVLAEVLAFLDELGDVIGPHLGVVLDHSMLMIGGDYADLVSSLRALQERVTTASTPN